MSNPPNLTYDQIYLLAEEIQKLKGARLQKVYSSHPNLYELEFHSFEEGTVRLVIDLSPARPLIFVRDFLTKIKTGKKTPVFNFLSAHFVGNRLEAIEVAQKPNRTIRLKFKGSDENFLTMRCFPHGQELKLEAADKKVFFPWKPAAKRKDEESIAFVEPDPKAGWDTNAAIAATVTLKSSGKKSEEALPVYTKIVKKLEKALFSIDGSAQSEERDNGIKIQELEREAVKLIQDVSAETESSGPGERIGEIYEEIKRLKRKKEVTQKRREDLQSRLDFLKTEEGQKKYSSPGPVPEVRKKSKEDGFSGTRIKIDGSWELWVGRTDWQNDDLLRLVSPEDIWIHLRDYPGAHGVLRGPRKKNPPDSMIEYSCCVVATLSQKKKNPFQEGLPLDFIVTPRKFVKKPKGAAPGKVIVEREMVRRVAFRVFKFEVT